MKTGKIKTECLLLVILSIIPFSAFSQDGGDDKLDLSGAVTVTTEGISIVPALSLGKPAAIFNLSVGKRLTFEPDLRFSMEGKPWSFLFWFRYDVLNTEKFKLRIGGHPAINFKTISATMNGAAREMISARRFLAGELNASYSLSKQVSIGTYYLYGHGFETSVPAHTHYLTFNSNISDIHLFRGFFLTLTPQFYYLKIDHDEGFYAASSVNLGKEDVPLSLSAFYNQTVHSDISGSPDVLWNVSLNYSFSF